jgi:tRNA-dependent cyclodipeptide synthase
MVVVKSFYPTRALTEFERTRKCCVGVSVRNPVFRGSRLSTLINWLRETTDSCLFLVGDTVVRYNLIIQSGSSMKPEEAMVQAQEAGLEQVAALRRAFQPNEANRFHICTISDLFLDGSIRTHQLALRNVFEKQARFRRSIRITAEGFVKSLDDMKRLRSVTREQAIQLSMEYLLEELAAYCVIHERGWLVDVYPGPELQVLLEIMDGKHPGVPEVLRHRYSISLGMDAYHTLRLGDGK